MLKKLWPKVCW